MYARIDFETNQMQGRQQELPAIWTTPGGATIHGFNKLSQQALFGFGWIPVIYNDLSNMETHKHCSTPVYDEENKTFVYKVEPLSIIHLKTESEKAIDIAASEACARYISQGIGQEMRYLMKQEQAINFIADSMPNMDNYPMLKREANETGVTPEELAELILETSTLWINLAAEIEALRCGGKKKCRTAKNAVEIIDFGSAAISALQLV